MEPFQARSSEGRGTAVLFLWGITRTQDAQAPGECWCGGGGGGGGQGVLFQF